MSYYAVAMSRTDAGWNAAEVDLDDVADPEEAADVLREVEPDADVALLFVESDDEYLAVLRLDDGEDLRVFGSDAAFATQSRVGEALVGDLEPVRPPSGAAADDLDAVTEVVDVPELDGLDDELAADEPVDDLDEADAPAAAGRANQPAAPPVDDSDADDTSEAREAAVTAGDPVGDADLLADLGTNAAQLLALCAHEGMLPGDVIAEVCGRAGCGDQFEDLRDSATL